MSDEKKGKRLPPWLSGIIDTLVGAGLLLRSDIPHRNRLAVILLDSAFETACRAFLKYKENIKLDNAHKHRDNLMKAVKSKLKGIDESVWSSLDFYYNEIRCDFYHESSGKTITDESVEEYQETVEFVIDNAFNIRSAEISDKELRLILSKQGKFDIDQSLPAKISLSTVKDKIDKVLIAVASVSPQNSRDVNVFFKHEGDAIRLKSQDFTNIVARNSGSKKLFYFDKTQKIWELSSLGRFKLKQIRGGETEDAR